MRWSLLLCALGCSPAAPVAEPVELRSWALPQGYTERVVRSLDRLLGSGDEAVGHATEGPGGSLLVVAPRGVLAGVDALVRETTEHASPPAPHNIEIQYWVVRGVRASEASRGPGLDEL